MSSVRSRVTPAALARGRAYPLWQSVSLVATSPQTANVAALMAYVKSKQGQRIIASLGFGQGGNSP